MKNLLKEKVLLLTFLLASIMLPSACELSPSDETQVDKVLTIKDGDSISVNASSSDVFIGVSSDSKAHLTYYEYDSIKYDVTENENGFVLNLRESSNGRVKGITILVPAIKVGAFSINTASGDIEFSELNSNGNINIKANSGNVTGTIVGTKDDFTVDSSSGSGKNNIKGQYGSGSKKLTVKTNSGDVSISFKK